MSFELRDYQREAVEIIESMEEGEKKLIVLPTGGGKTICFATIANNAKGKTIIITPSTELRTQAIEKIIKINPNADIGSVQGSLDEIFKDKKILVCTRQSLAHKKSNRIERMLKNGDFEYCIIDEVHLALDQVNLILSKLNKNIKVVGVTATAFQKKLKDIFSDISYQKPLLEMINQGYLCQPRAFKVSTDVDLSNVKSVAGDFNQGELEDCLDTPERNQMVVDGWKKYASDRKHCIVFCAGIAHSQHIQECFNKNGIACKAIDSKVDRDDRKEILETFKSGDYPVITNVNVLSTGFDFEALDCIIMASSTKSKTKFLQCLGRGLRTFPDKEDCLILDMEDVCSSHDLMSLDDIFSVTIKHGESLKEAQERNEQEIEEENERQRLRTELEAQREIEAAELHAKEIELFNASIGNAISEVGYYHWWMINKNLWALSTSSDYHYVISKADDMFNVLEINTTKDKNSIELVNSGSSVLEMIEYVESDVRKITSFMRRDGEWKQDPASPAQIRAVKYATVSNKWQVHQYFSQWKIKTVMKQFKAEAA